MKKMIILLSFLSQLTFKKIYSQSSPPDTQITLKVRDQEKKILNELKIIRLKRKKAPPIILSHAFMLSNLTMKKLGFLLWKSGFDVWMPNMRGHGNGYEQSICTHHNKTKKFFEFDKIVTEDWPYLLEHIYKIKKQKVNILGFSIGGMTWEKVLSGVRKDQNGKTVHDLNLAKKLSRKVASFIELGVPVNLNSINPIVTKLVSPLSSVFKIINSSIPFTTCNSSVQDEQVF